ncbi:3D domain-containing protein [Oribacterium sp. P6A1]|uniref:3D domain-containing protein n=1 Tax=Oribacterium sp. P6A1 TaxID=1410612 RepID=UPI0006898378|nr:3D domain-containing protein [Oribacterium sp. P6A1]
MKLAELKTLAAAVMFAAVVSSSALAAEVTGPTGSEWTDASLVNGYSLENTTDAELDAEMQSEIYAEEVLSAHLAELAQMKASARPGETPIGDKVTEESTHYVKGASLGTFCITGYYGGGVTYSGAPTVADHTIAADLSVLPMGTKVFINNTVYTVEDIGSGVRGNMIDIYYNTYAEAAGVTELGWRYADVYLAVYNG